MARGIGTRDKAMGRRRIVWPAAAALALLAMLLGAGPQEASRQAISDAVGAGHWAEALNMARLRLESGDGSGADLRDACRCLRELGRLTEFDPLVERTIQRYGENPEVLVAAMGEYTRTPHYGHEVAGEFRRGAQRGRGATLSVEEADRVRVLRLGERVLRIIGTDANSNAIQALDHMREALTKDRSDRQSWRLQELTPLKASCPNPRAACRPRRAIHPWIPTANCPCCTK